MMPVDPPPPPYIPVGGSEGDQPRDRVRGVPRNPLLPATPPAECGCESITIRTDYGTGVEYDVDTSDCPVHTIDGDGEIVATPTTPATPPADDASERRFRDPVTGDVGPVHDPVCAALAHDDEDSCSCGAMDAASTDASEVEALAKVLADLPTDPEHYARLILASDWLAARESAAATRAGAEGAAEASGRIARTLIAERNARVLHSPAWFAFDDAARLARSDAAPHTGGQP